MRSAKAGWAFAYAQTHQSFCCSHTQRRDTGISSGLNVGILFHYIAKHACFKTDFIHTFSWTGFNAQFYHIRVPPKSQQGFVADTINQWTDILILRSTYPLEGNRVWKQHARFIWPYHQFKRHQCFRVYTIPKLNRCSLRMSTNSTRHNGSCCDLAIICRISFLVLINSNTAYTAPFIFWALM